jgi:hypothetical protein
MNPTPDLDVAIAAWLDEGPTDLPDTTRRAIAAALPTTNQRRRSTWAPWRFSPMPAFARAAIAVLVAAVVIGGGIYFLGPRGGGPGASPSPSTSPERTERPTPTPIDPSSWVPFTTSRFGYTLRYPGDWVVTPATEAMTFEILTSSELDNTAEFDHFTPSGATLPEFTGTSSRIPEGMSEDEWIAAYRAPVVEKFGEECFPTRDKWTPVTVDGNAGGLYRGCAYVESTTFVGGRAYIFTVYIGFGAVVDASDVELLEAFLSTASLNPAAADDR